MATYTTNLPVNGTFNVSAAFGQTGKMWETGHRGVDITSKNLDLYSICDGEVTVVGWDENGWGRYVSVKPTGFERIRIISCHLKKNSAKVKKGDTVSRLTKIGTMGSTGKSSGVHVHIEMRIDNTPVDPTPYMQIANKKAIGLVGSDYKFDASLQKSTLTAILKAFDAKKSKESLHSECDAKIKQLETELKSTKERLAAAESKIENIKKIIS